MIDLLPVEIPGRLEQRTQQTAHVGHGTAADLQPSLLGEVAAEPIAGQLRLLEGDPLHGLHHVHAPLPILHRDALRVGQPVGDALLLQQLSIGGGGLGGYHPVPQRLEALKGIAAPHDGAIGVQALQEHGQALVPVPGSPIFVRHLGGPGQTRVERGEKVLKILAVQQVLALVPMGGVPCDPLKQAFCVPMLLVHYPERLGPSIPCDAAGIVLIRHPPAHFLIAETLLQADAAQAVEQVFQLAPPRLHPGQRNPARQNARGHLVHAHSLIDEMPLIQAAQRDAQGIVVRLFVKEERGALGADGQGRLRSAVAVRARGMASDPAPGQLGHPKVADHDPSVQAVEICGLDVPVEDVRAVHTVQCLVEILDQRDHFLKGGDPVIGQIALCTVGCDFKIILTAAQRNQTKIYDRQGIPPALPSAHILQHFHSGGEGGRRAVKLLKIHLGHHIPAVRCGA